MLAVDAPVACRADCRLASAVSTASSYRSRSIWVAGFYELVALHRDLRDAARDLGRNGNNQGIDTGLRCVGSYAVGDDVIDH
jgi:hypothetical protein